MRLSGSDTFVWEADRRWILVEKYNKVEIYVRSNRIGRRHKRAKVS